MSFVINGCEKFNLSDLKQQFSNFLRNEDRLPFCHINFLERPMNLMEDYRLLKRAGDFSIYIHNDKGIAIGNHTAYALVDKDFSKIDVYLSSRGVYPKAQIAFLILHAYRYILIKLGHFQIHSASVVHDGVGIAFCGLPGAGKSTQAGLWERYLGAEPLNLDQPCILIDGDDIAVSGSPWSGKECCYKNDSVPLGGIFFVEQAKENTVERMSKAEGFSYLLLNNYLVPTSDEMEQKHRQAVMNIVENVPVYRLRCTISEQAVRVAYNAVFGE